MCHNLALQHVHVLMCVCSICGVVNVAATVKVLKYNYGHDLVWSKKSSCFHVMQRRFVVVFIVVVACWLKISFQSHVWSVLFKVE